MHMKYSLPFLVLLTVGQDHNITTLQDLLFNSGCQRVLRLGLGGVGKTHTALQLAYWTEEKKQGYSVF